MAEIGKKNEEYFVYFKRLKTLDDRVSIMLKELYALRHCVIKGVCIRERVQTSPSNNQMVDFLSDITKKEEEIDIAVDKFVEYKEDMLKRVNSLENKRYSEFLIKRFVEYKTISKIAEENSMSISGVKKLQRKSIDCFADKYKFIC